MENISKEVLALLDKYGSDRKTALKENRRLDYLYALSDLRENLLEWYEFEKAPLLQVGADYGALTGLFSRKAGQVTVLDEEEANLDVVRARYKGNEGIRCLCGSLSELHNLTGQGQALEGQSFRYITMIGSLQKPFETQIEAAKSLLCPGGVLFTAACNPLGMKYLAGAGKDEFCATRNELAQLLPGGSFYYPLPDYRLPFSVYSDQYLPKKGDLTNALTVYDYPRYLFMDVGANYDIVCEDGQFQNFANSFLVIWKKGEQN